MKASRPVWPIVAIAEALVGAEQRGGTRDQCEQQRRGFAQTLGVLPPNCTIL